MKVSLMVLGNNSAMVRVYEDPSIETWYYFSYSSLMFSYDTKTFIYYKQHRSNTDRRHEVQALKWLGLDELTKTKNLEQALKEGKVRIGDMEIVVEQKEVE
jgi:hypothetical protein